MMSPRAQLLLQQVCDSVFPIGAYSHSYGLETYVQLGRVHDSDTARAYLEAQIRYPLTYTELLGMRLAYEAAERRDAASLARLEGTLSALKTPLETRTASQKLAARFIRTVSGLDVLGAEEASFFKCYAAARSLHAVNAAYGVFASLAGIELDELLRRYLYAQVSALVVTAVKTVPLSQTAGQRLIADAISLELAAVEAARAASEDLLGLSCPGFDVRCVEHESLYSRLYMS